MSSVNGLQVGIDFGACNIKVARWNNKKKRPKRMHLDSNQDNPDYKIPNAIAYLENEDGVVEKVVGDAAVESFEPENTIGNIKYYLQQKEWSKYVPSLKRRVYIDEVLEDIFSYLKNTIEEQSGEKKIEETVITTPVCFSEIQKKKIVQAAKRAGLPVKEVISEPLAALFAIQSELDVEKENIVLIFDFGGATLDLSLVRVKIQEEKTEVSPLSSTGIIYGGLDINEDIYEKIFIEKYEELKEFLQNHECGENVKNDFLNTVEKMKRSLSREKIVEREWRPYTGEKFLAELELENDEFISMLKVLGRNKKIICEIDNLFELASISRSKVTHLAMIGGSARIFFFKDLILDYLSGVKLLDIDEEEMYSAVSEGAVKYLHMLEERNLSLTNILTYSVGYETGNGMFERMIKRGVRFGYGGRKTKITVSGERLNIYQTFGNSNKSEISQDETIIYMGFFDLKEYISTTDKMLVAFNIKKDGSLQLDVYDGKQMVGSLDLVME